MLARVSRTPTHSRLANLQSNRLHRSEQRTLPATRPTVQLRWPTLTRTTSWACSPYQNFNVQRTTTSFGGYRAPLSAWRSFSTAAATQASEVPAPKPNEPLKLPILELTEEALNRIQYSPPEKEITQQSMAVGINNFAALKDSFAVVQVGGHQFKVTEGDEIMVNKIDNVPVQTKILLDKVLLVGTKSMTAIGTPLLPNVKVLAEVEEHNFARKIIVFKKKRRHGYKRHRGHRQPYTLLRIIDVVVKNT